jgi:hypothetical protein
LTTILDINVHFLLLLLLLPLLLPVLLPVTVWAAGALSLSLLLLLLLLLLTWLCLLLELLHEGAIVAECVDAASNSLQGLNHLHTHSRHTADTQQA